jgi:hypothetical protein
VGVKAITRSDGAAPDRAVGFSGRTPLIEAMAQLAAYLLGDAEAREGRRVLSLMIGVDRLRFHDDPRPGDRLILDVRVAARGPEGARVEVTARADERPVADGRLTFAFFAAETPAQARDFDWTQAHLALLMAQLSPPSKGGDARHGQGGVAQGGVAQGGVEAARSLAPTHPWLPPSPPVEGGARGR